MPHLKKRTGRPGIPALLVLATAFALLFASASRAQEPPAEPAAVHVAEPAPETIPLAFVAPPESNDQEKGCNSLSIRFALSRPGTVTLHAYPFPPAESAAIEAALAAQTRTERDLRIARTRHHADTAAVELLLAQSVKLADEIAASRDKARVAALASPAAAEAKIDLSKIQTRAGRSDRYAGTLSLTGLPSDRGHVVRAVATAGEETVAAEPFVVRTNAYFKPYSLQVFLIGFILVAVIMLSIRQAESGRDFYIRRIAGLNAIDEAVGRATEMGKPVLYLTGLHDLSSIATLASISILGHVAQKTAEYETPILIPNCRSIVMVTVKEVVRESYLMAGKADHFVEDNITYLTDDQFGFVSGVDGIMVREKPAANFYLGHFMAESLIYAETGHSVGAIQIAGTEEFSQIPFFITACDYTLIGEELFAAGAYLSRKPRDVGSLRGQDIGKLIIILTVVAGVLFQSAAYATGAGGLLAFGDWFVSN